MKLRTQLAVTFLAFTILPLGGLAGYSYYASSAAVRAALEEEAAELAKEMDAKLDVARQWIARTVESVEPIAFESLIAEDGDAESRAARQIVRDMGTAAPLVRSFEFIPSPETPAVPASPDSTSAPGVPSAPEPPVPPSHRKIVIDIRETLQEVEAERRELEAAGQAGKSMEFAFKVLESIPLDVIMEDSMTAMKAGLAEAERSLAEKEAALVEIDDPPATEEQLEEKRRAIAATRDALASIAAERAVSETGSERNGTSRETETVRMTPPAQAAEDRAAPSIPVVRDGQIVGSVKAEVHDEEILREIFLSTAGQGDEIPFAIDSSGAVRTRSTEDDLAIQTLTQFFLQDEEVQQRLRSSPTATLIHEGWVIATSRDESGLIIGVARPATEAIAEVRKATVRSLGLGLALVGICLIGILPLANHMTRDITAVTAGAERISEGDLDSHVDVSSRNEVGRLAAVFNRMASELRTNQARLVQEETARREQEIREQLLKEEYDRTTAELDEAREFQLSMLPSSLPRLENLEIAVDMTTATEVGGDYYDFHTGEEAVTIAIGDGTGHGAKAGTMVAVIKSLFTALTSSDLKRFLREASATIRTMQLGRMSMALTLLRFEEGRLRFAAAGMPPLLLVRSKGEIEELSSPGAPLGTIDFPYEERSLTLDPGDLVIAMSDGLPELLDETGEPFGYERVTSAVRDIRSRSPEAIIRGLQEAARDWRGNRPLQDDMTLLVIRYVGGSPV
ncbi:MAG: SpoIIE family protein phosphatase [Thermoanaerobaculia bacterium]|nr:SpoIIE family protein phosphatase [Thermoanaerobaculia bacterium]